jgi:hypothetical protein
MRSAFFIAAGVAMAISSQALAASQTPAATSNMPATDAPMQSSGPHPQTTTPSDNTPPSTSGSAADTSATAGASAAAALSVGEPVKDNTGATIGAISSISTNANGQTMAVIKMGNDTFQVPGDRLGVTEGSATINLSQAQITGMIHPAAGGR